LASRRAARGNDILRCFACPALSQACHMGTEGHALELTAKRLHVRDGVDVLGEAGRRGGEVHIYCYWSLGSFGQVHAYQMTSSVNIISIKPNRV